MRYYQKDYYKIKKRLERRHEIFAERILELGNIAAGALVFGNFLSGKFYSGVFIMGVIFVIFIYWLVWYNLCKFKQ